MLDRLREYPRRIWAFFNFVWHPPPIIFFFWQGLKRAGKCFLSIILTISFRSSAMLLWNLRRAARESDSLACGFGSMAGRRRGAAFALRFRGFRFGLWRARVPDQLSQELKLGQEELPHHVPTCKTTTDQSNTESVPFKDSLTCQWGNKQAWCMLWLKEKRKKKRLELFYIMKYPGVCWWKG